MALAAMVANSGSIVTRDGIQGGGYLRQDREEAKEKRDEERG